MLIDTHHHLWNYNGREYGWIEESMSILKRNYLPEDLEPELPGSGVTGTVVVQARQCVEETRWLLDQASGHRFIMGVVGWLDLCSPELPDDLEKYGTHPKLVGLRHLLQDEPDDGFMFRDDFIRGISQMEAYDLVYDLLLFPRHLESAAVLAEMFPGQKFVLDHLGKPDIRKGELEPWRSAIEILADRSNVWCKLSGMVTEADHRHWQYGDLLPFMEVAMSVFGPERLMLGSDWPVCRLAAEYGEVMAIPVRLAGALDKTDRDRIFYGNAIECYQLNKEFNGETEIQTA